MDYIDDNTRVTSNMEPYKADKKLAKRMEKDEKIRSRIWELDFLRGVCVILMIWDHLMFDLGFDMFSGIWFEATGNEAFLHLAEFADNYWISSLRAVVRPIVVMCFFVLCGISCSFSRSNLKRGSILLGFALLITAVTMAVGVPIRFGVLHMLAIAILVVALVRFLTKGHKWIYAITSLSLGIVLVLIEVILQYNVPAEPNEFLFIFSRVWYPGGGYSMDYFPILPNVGIVLIGASLAPLLYPKKRTLLPCLDTSFRWYRPINFFGRHAAIFYILHQVAWAVLLGLFTIIFIPNGWNVLVDAFFT